MGELLTYPLLVASLAEGVFATLLRKPSASEAKKAGGLLRKGYARLLLYRATPGLRRFCYAACLA
jgi:hypothetical protein